MNFLTTHAFPVLFNSNANWERVAKRKLPIAKDAINRGGGVVEECEFQVNFFFVN